MRRVEAFLSLFGGNRNCYLDHCAYLWLIISSLSFKIDLLSVPLRWIPSRLTLENYTPCSLCAEVSRSIRASFSSRLAIQPLSH